MTHSPGGPGMAVSSRCSAFVLGRHALTLAAIALLAQGCRIDDRVSWLQPMRAPEIPDESSVEEIVQVLNINTLGTQTQQGLKSWNATSASVSVPGMVNVPATIAVEAPRNLRIRIAHPISRSELFDLGSNPEEFWVWARDAEPRGVVHVKHEEVDIISRYFDLPIHPDWMMEVFGVVALNPDEYRREESDEGARYAELVGHKTAPNGMRVTNVIRVDLRRGVIVRRSLHADDGSVLGVANYADHRRDGQSQLMLPREISLEVPAMGSEVTFYLKNVQLNPPPMQARVWQPPQIAGEPDIQLVKQLPPEAFEGRGSLVSGSEEMSPLSYEPEGRMHLSDPRAISGIGGSVEPDRWSTDEDDNLPLRGITDFDPYSTWGDIGTPDVGDGSATTTAFDAEQVGGDAPPWGLQVDYEPTPYETSPPESDRQIEFAPTEPAVDAYAEWAQ
jgi:hypothetical protein